MKKKPNPAIPMPPDTRTVPLHQEIATQAFVLWNSYGQPSGRDLGIWLEAERQVLGTDKQVNQQAGGAVDAQQLGMALAAEPLPGTPSSEAGRLARRDAR